MYYIYFVSFSADGGFGNAEVTLTEEIRDIKDLRPVALDLEKQGVRKPIVLNYQLLRVEEDY